MPAPVVVITPDTFGTLPPPLPQAGFFIEVCQIPAVLVALAV